jgi:ankyrin repeat protein
MLAFFFIFAIHGATDENAAPSMAISVPLGVNDKAVASPADLHLTVIDEWDAVVGNNDNGLVPAKDQNKPQPPLGEEEAWYQYERTQSGNVDSARFLLVFGMVPSIKSGGSAIHTAAASGDVEALKENLEKGTALIAVNEQKKDGMTPLITASMMGHANVVAYLIEEGADVEAVGTNGATALMIASMMGHTNVMELLLEAGAIVDSEHKFAKNTALHFASEMGRAEAVELLCKHNASVEKEKTNGGRAIHTAADTNNTAVVRVLANVTGPCKADVNALLLGDSTPLYLAAQRGFVAVGKVLLANGAKTDFSMPTGKLGQHVALPAHFGPGAESNKYPNQAGSDPFAAGYEVGNGATALHAAVENGHLEMTRMLLEAGAIQSAAMEGCTPLCSASQYNHPSIAALLITHGGARPEVRLPRGGDTPMIDSIKRRNYKVTAAMAEAGRVTGEEGKLVNSITEHTDARGLQPIFWAIRTMGTEVADSLLNNGADPNAVVEDTGRGGGRGEHLPGTRALHAAIGEGRNDVTALLLRAGADVKAKGATNQLSEGHAASRKTGVPALHLAAAKGNEDLVRALVQRGAEVLARGGRYHSTALHEAARHARPAALKLLLLAPPQTHGRADDGSEQSANLLRTRQANGHTLLHVAAAGATGAGAGEGADADRAEVISMLLHPAERVPGAAGTDAGVGLAIDGAGNKGDTALMVAVEAGNEVGVRLMLEEGADWTLADKKGKSALDACWEKPDGKEGGAAKPDQERRKLSKKGEQLRVMCVLPEVWRVPEMEGMLREADAVTASLVSRAQAAYDGVVSAGADGGPGGGEQGLGDKEQRAKYYLKLLQKALKHSEQAANDAGKSDEDTATRMADFWSSEKKRLTALLASDKVQPGQKAQFLVRKQVLGAIESTLTTQKAAPTGGDV